MRPAEAFARGCAMAAAGVDATPGDDVARAGAAEALQADAAPAAGQHTGPDVAGGFGASFLETPS